MPTTARPVTGAAVIQIEMPKASASDANGLLPAWLALVGVIVALIGKWIADWLQRRYEFRRQLYLDMVEAMQSVTHCIAHLSDPSTPLKDTLKKYQATSGPIAKVELAAPKRLSIVLTEFNRLSSAAYFQMMQMRYPIELCTRQLIVLEEQLLTFRKQQELLLDEIRRLSIDGNQDKDRRERVDRYYNNLSNNIQIVHDEKRLVQDLMSERTKQMTPIAVEWMKQFSAMMPIILMLARRGLGFWYFDLNNYQKRAQEDVIRIGKSMDQLQEFVKETLERNEAKGEATTN